MLGLTQQQLGTVIGVVLLLEDRGATNQAAAFCSIMAIVVGTLLAAHVLLRLLGGGMYR